MANVLRLAAVVFLAVWGGFIQAQEKRFDVTLGAANPICQSTLKILGRIPTGDFITNFKWMDRFEKRSDWTSAKTTFLRADGERVAYDFSYVQFDLDNDGSSELIVGRTDMMHSILVDTWYVYQRFQLGNLLAEGVSESKLAAIAKVGTDSVSGFIPVEFARWSFEGVNYVILREFGFLRKRKPAASLLVTKFDRVDKGLRQEAIAKMTPICDIRG